MNDKAIMKPMEKMRQLIIERRDQIAMALPQHLTPDRLIRVALTAIAKTPKLLECSQASVIGAVIQAAQLGLDVDGSLGHAFLVPYKSKCQLQIGYRGMIDLARRSGQIISLSAHVVYENDRFDYAFGLEDKLVHVPSIGKPGKPIAVYAVAKLKGGGHQFDVLSIAEIEKARNHSMTTRSDSPWNTHWDEMAKKTAIRRLFKYLPVSIEIQRAVGLDEQADSGLNQNLDALVIDVEPVTDTDTVPDTEPKKGLDKVKNKLKSKQAAIDTDTGETENPNDSNEAQPETAIDTDTDTNTEKGEPIFSVYEELDATLKRMYGNKAGEHLKILAKKAGFTSAALNEKQAGILLDILNEESPND